jgi:hypothetical protein
MSVKKTGRRSGGPGLFVRVVSVLLMLLPAVGAFLYIRAYGVDLTFGDAWTMVPLFEKLSAGTLGFGDLWKPHWEHRVLFPRVALLLAGVATGWDTIAVSYLIQACFLATTVVLFLAFARDGAPSRLLLFVPVPFLVFNLAQYFNMFFAFQLALVFAQLFGVLALYLLHLSRMRGAGRLAFLGALASGVVASFSLGSGLFVWPAGFLQILISPLSRAAKRLFLIVWGLAGVAAWVLYFSGLTVPDRQKGSYFLDDLDPLRQAEFLFTLLGSPFAWRSGLVSGAYLALPSALIFGVLLSGLVAVGLYAVYRARRLGEHSFWVGLLFFGLFCTASIMLARSGGPIEGAMESRYITFSGLVAVGAYGLISRLAAEGASRLATASLGLLLALVVLGMPFSYAHGIQKGQALNETRSAEAAAFSSYSTRPNESLDIANRYSGYVRRNAYALCKLGYSAFSDPAVRARNCLPPPFSSLSPTGSSAPSRILAVSGVKLGDRDREVVIPEGRASIRVLGLATSPGGEEPAGGVYLKVDDELFPAFYGKNLSAVRGDNGKDTPVVLFSGFEGNVPVRKVGPGEHKLSVVVVTRDRKGYYEPGAEVTIEVRR